MLCLTIPLDNRYFPPHRNGENAAPFAAYPSKNPKYAYDLAFAFPTVKIKEDYIRATGKRADFFGRLKPTMEKMTIDRTNNGVDILAKGAIGLDSIKADMITVNPSNGLKFVKCIFRTKTTDGTPIFCGGSVRLSDINESDIVINPRTGRRNVPCVMRKLPKMDMFYNTHELVILKPDGSEIQIGLFKEFKNATEIQKRVVSHLPPSEPQEQEKEPSKDIPDSIDGFKF